MTLNRLPINGTFELTGRCNLQCSMCYVRVDRAAIEASGKRERSAAEWIRMAEQAAEAGTLTLLLTGGEVTLRPDFPEIYEAIAQMGFVTTVYTNATIVSDNLMALFEKYPPHRIGITMYGASAESYQAVCGHADGYERFLSGLRKLKTLPSLLDLRTTLVKQNVTDYEAMKDFARQELGDDQVLHVSTIVYNSIRGGISNPCIDRLDGKTNAEFFGQGIIDFNKRIESGEIPAEKVLTNPALLKLEQDLKRHSLGREGGYLFENCGAGLNSYHISWAGEMYACTMLAEGCTHPFEDGFAEAWRQLPQQYPSTKISEKCKTCDIAGYCQSCPAQRMAETGFWEGAPTYACESAARLQEIMEPLFSKAKNISIL